MKYKPQLTFLPLIISTLFLNNIVNADAVFDPNSQPISVLAPYVLKATNLEDGDTKAYRPWFEMSTWQGDIIEYNVSKNGALSTDVTDLESNPPTVAGSNWSARATMAAKELANIDYWTKKRKVITSISGTDQQAFRWDQLSKSQQLELDPTGKNGENILDFLRGSREEENVDLRTRTGILGDITSSMLVYVGRPSTGYTTMPGYADFANKARAGRIYAGLNDGMVHAFDETDGSEIFAYVPSMLFSSLGDLSAISYTHKSYINSELLASDAQIGTTWKTVLTGGLGAGGKGLFALDVTSPDLTNEKNNTGTDKKILWEKHGKDDNDLGHIFGQSSIVKLSDNKWYVINGNGYGSTNGSAKLYLVEVGTGTVKKLSTLFYADNGLSSPVLVDTDYDSIADLAYAGDLKGNLWKFDLTDLNKPGKIIFTAGAKKPITVQPEIAQHPLGDFLIYFGTGSLLSAADIDNTDQQSIYAIWDKDTLVSDACGNSKATLLCQELSDSISAGTKAARTVSEFKVDWNNHGGWKVDLSLSGERLLVHPQLRNGRLQFTTHNPAEHTDKSWLVELNYLTGGSSGKVLFDLNADGSLNDSDKILGKAPAALYLGEGYFSQPAIVRIENGIDTLFINGLLMGYTESLLCTGDCANGLAGGHFDLDTDATLSGSTDNHTHEYDDKYDVTYGDYFNVLSGKKVTEVGITSNSQKLLAFIANADLSTGGNIIIGNRIWNVVEYQKMIQKQLMNWDGLSDLVDEHGDPLAFTLDQINEAVGGTGTLRISFNNTAILTGGLIPTKSGCVKSSPNITNGHWRGGALTLHVVDYEAVRNNIINADLATDRVYLFQTVNDLPDSITTLSAGSIKLREDTNSDGTIDTEYAGIIANPANDSGFLYESTIFWHYKGGCYGEPSWEAQKNAAVITEQELADFLTQEAALIAEIQSYSCTEFKKGVCKDSAYTSLLDKLKSEIGNTFDNSSNDIENIALSIAEIFIGTTGYNATINASTTPPTDETEIISKTPGPSFRWGRQSWIDF